MNALQALQPAAPFLEMAESFMRKYFPYWNKKSYDYERNKIAWASLLEQAAKQEREECAILCDDLGYWNAALLIRARHTAPPVSADNKETNV